jgi:uncharacterized protein (TIGR02145 family)
MGSAIGNTSGGLVGSNESGSITNSYSTGNVNGTASTNGGLIGENGKGTVTNSYYDRQASGQSDIVNKGEPKSTAQMKQQAIFSGWDFDDIWKMDEKNNGYPYLQSSEKSLPVKYKYPHEVQQGNVLTDKRDGKKYKTVIINNQTWMAENLNYNASSSKCYYNESANCTKYGRLYDWKTAIKACPSGWHLPTRKEWNELDDYADMYLDGAGTHFKATSGWDKHNGTDDFGFSALPGGSGLSIGFLKLGDVGYDGRWWSASEYNSYDAYSRSMDYHKDRAYWYYGGKDYLYSVRCLRD